MWTPLGLGLDIIGTLLLLSGPLKYYLAKIRHEYHGEVHWYQFYYVLGKWLGSRNSVDASRTVMAELPGHLWGLVLLLLGVGCQIIGYFTKA